MTQAMSKLSSNNPIAGQASRLIMGSSAAALGVWCYLLLRRQSRLSKRLEDEQQVLFLDTKAAANDKVNRKKNKIDFSETFRKLRVILKFVISFNDLTLACGVSISLVLRTLLDLWNIQISTKVESAIISANRDNLKQTLISFALIMPTLAFVNNMIRYFSDNLRLRLRYKLSKILYDKYMNELTYYHLAQQGSFENVDHILTADVDKFCSSIVEVYNNLSKPVLDIILLVYRMSTGSTGIQTPAMMIGWLAIVGCILTKARQPLSRYIIRETQSEGQLRFIHSRLIQNSEEVAFFRGQKKEKNTLFRALDLLRHTLEDSILFRFKLEFMDNIVGRYSSTIVGYLALAKPFMDSTGELASSHDRLTHYYVSGRMMMKIADSITRVIMAGQDISKLAAYTQRVSQLLDSMEKLDHKDPKISGVHKEPPALSNGETRDDIREASVTVCDPDTPTIEFEGVTLSTPNGDILVKDLTFAIKPGQSVIIAGPNGSGKSSLFRVLGGLWQIERGRIVRPPPEHLFYICQKPYMTLGSLRDQLIFPHVDAQYDDHKLAQILKVVELQYLLQRDQSFDSICDWQDVLSGGEKQRMALARLIYHKPKFAILDECTSAVSIEVEQRIYKYLKDELECTLLSVSHRVKQLAKFHHLILNFDGEGHYEFRRLEAAEL